MVDYGPYIALGGGILIAIGWAWSTHGWPRWIILCGAFLAALGGFGSFTYQAEYDRGGTSYCYLLPGFDVTRDAIRTGRVSIDLHRDPEERYPLYDINIMVTDVQAIQRLIGELIPLPPAQRSLAQLEPAIKRYPPINRLEPRQGIVGLDIWQLPQNADRQDFDVRIMARNGTILQRMSFRRLNGQWRMGTRVMRDNRVLKEDGPEYLQH